MNQYLVAAPRRMIALMIGMLLVAGSLCLVIPGWAAPQDANREEPIDPLIGSKWFVPVDPKTMYSNAPTIRPGTRVFMHDASKTASANETIYVAGAQNTAVLMGLATRYVVISSTTMVRTTWNGQLYDGTIKVIGGALEGSIRFLTKGDLYVEAASATGTPPGGSTPSPYAFPIVVTTSGGVRAGSVGTAWFCCCIPGILDDDEYIFALLDNPPATGLGMLYVGKGDCWGSGGPACERKTLTDTTQYISVKGTTIYDPAPIDSKPGLQGRIDAAKARAVTVGLRAP